MTKAQTNRLNGSGIEPPETGSNPRAHGRYRFACCECGAAFQTNRTEAQFCGNRCRAEFHNRRQKRGAILYDLFMVNRHDRALAKAHRVWFLLTRLAMYWREQDVNERRGRRSWQRPEDAINQVGWANATIVHRPAPRN